MEIVETLNSTYEIDHEHRRVRRMNGKNFPVLLVDGEWKYYDTHDETWYGSRFFTFPDGRVMHTSAVVSSREE
jgi:hypothetical protein